MPHREGANPLRPRTHRPNFTAARNAEKHANPRSILHNNESALHRPAFLGHEWKETLPPREAMS